MSKPTVAANKPIKIELKSGEKYFFCACGKSATQPFCDGSHKGTGFSPKVFLAEKEEDARLCMCKQTSDPPYCDGTHAKIPDDKVGEEFALSSEEGERDNNPT